MVLTPPERKRRRSDLGLPAGTYFMTTLQSTAHGHKRQLIVRASPAILSPNPVEECPVKHKTPGTATGDFGMCQHSLQLWRLVSALVRSGTC